MTSYIKTFLAALALTTAYGAIPAFSQTHADNELAGASKPAAEKPAAQHEAHDHSGHDHNAHKNAAPMMMPDIDHVFTEAPDDHVIGSATAPITMIVYASVTCPHCGQWFTSEWPTFKKEQIDTGNVRFIMREYPTPPAQLAMAGFYIINCAPEDEYFTHLVTQMQSQQTVFQAIEDRKVRQVYDSFALKARLSSPQAMSACFDDETIQSRIERSLIRAQATDIKGVPAFVINGKLAEGDLSAAGLAAMIEQTLSGGVSAPNGPAEPGQDITPYESKPE